MKVYGAPICPNCRKYKAFQEKRGFEAEYVDITASLGNLKEFLQLRDNDSLFDEVKAAGSVGIPVFMNDDEDITFDINEALSWIGEPPVTKEEFKEIYADCDGSCCLQK